MKFWLKLLQHTHRPTVEFVVPMQQDQISSDKALICPKYSKTLTLPYTVKPVKNGHFQIHRKLVYKTNYRLMQVKSIAECSKGSILQYFRPSLSYHLSLSSLFFLFLSGSFSQILLYNLKCEKSSCWGVWNVMKVLLIV